MYITKRSKSLSLIQKNEIFGQAFGSCDHSELHVPTSHDGHFEVPVLVHVPKVDKCLHS